MIPKIIHLTTKDGCLNKDETIILNKNKKKFNNWDVKIYSDEDNNRIIKTYFPHLYDKYMSISRGVMKADIMRCLYLYLYGGLYIDTDYYFYKTLPEKYLNLQCVIPTEHFENDGTPFLGNCIMFSNKGYSFWIDFVTYLFQNFEMDKISENEIIGCTGPGGITRFYLENISKYKEITYTKQDEFHPLIVNHHLGVKKTKNTIGAHFCFGSWRSKSHSKLSKYIYVCIQHIQARGLNILNF